MSHQDQRLPHPMPPAPMQIRQLADLTESGWYWWRAWPEMDWDAMKIIDPQRLSYGNGIRGFEFIGPITPPPSR